MIAFIDVFTTWFKPYTFSFQEMSFVCPTMCPNYKETYENAQQRDIRVHIYVYGHMRMNKICAYKLRICSLLISELHCRLQPIIPLHFK